MEISYTLKDFDPRKISNKYGLTNHGRAELFMANTCFRRMFKYVPLRTGALASTVIIRPGSVTYTVPYARRQFYENKGSGLRGKRWDKKTEANEKSMIAQEVESYIKTLKGSS